MEKEILPLIDFSKVKKKRKEILKDGKESEDLSNIMIKKKKHKEENIKDEENKESEKEKLENGNNEEEYTYEFLLERVYKMIKSRDSNSTENRGAIKIPVPQVNLVGKSRSAWINFNDFVKVLNRSQEHLFQYVLLD